MFIRLNIRYLFITLHSVGYKMKRRIKSLYSTFLGQDGTAHQMQVLTYDNKARFMTKFGAKFQHQVSASTLKLAPPQ